MLIIKTKKDLAAYVATSEVVLETKRAYEEDEPGGFEEVEKELVKLLATGDGSPDFGEDWEDWLTNNIAEQLEEAVSIVM